MKLAGAVCAGSRAVNEDGWGFAGYPKDVEAAWIFDGVTGINGRDYLPAESDACWLVQQAHRVLGILAVERLPLETVLERLVDRLVEEFAAVAGTLDLPADYDPPAACLILVKRYKDGWKALRLGDSCLLAQQPGGQHHLSVISPNNAFDNWLAREARKRREEGQRDSKALLAEFRPQLQAGRRRRNVPGGYSILEASRAALVMPEVIPLGWPTAMLLCTDGYYRATDHYGLYDSESLLASTLAAGGAEKILAEIRSIEAGDPDCLRFPRFKPSDDATAVALC